MFLPIAADGTGHFNESEYYMRASGTWTRIESSNWLSDLKTHLPDDREIHKGIWPDLLTMRAETALYRADDANCCPTGGTVRIQLAIRDNRFVVESAVMDMQL